MTEFDQPHRPDPAFDKGKNAGQGAGLSSGAGLPPGGSAIGQAPQLDLALIQRRTMFTAVRWGAVLAGVAVGVSVQLALTLLGMASGLSATRIGTGESIDMGPLLWSGGSMLISAFVGGYVAARMSGLKRQADGVLHGAVSWAVTTILFAVLATSIGGALIGGVFNNMVQLAQAQDGSRQAALGPFTLFMRDQVGRLDRATLDQLRRHVQSGERVQAVQLLHAATGMAWERAETVIDRALILNRVPQAVERQGGPVDSVLQGSGVTAWVVFGAVALGLLLGMGGGRLGAAGSRRIDWSVRPESG